MWNFGRTSDDEALRLVVAFLGISEPERRQELIGLAEQFQLISIKPIEKSQAVAQDNEPLRRAPADSAAPR